MPCDGVQTNRRVHPQKLYVECLCPASDGHFGRHSTPSNISTICSATETLAVSAPAAALSSSAATCCDVSSPRLFGQMPEQRAHVGERGQIHDGRDCQRDPERDRTA